MPSALERLQAGAARRGWRLVWTSETSPLGRTLTETELDLYEGRRLLNVSRRYIIHHASQGDPDNGLASAMESLAEMAILDLAATGGRGNP